MYIVAKGTSLLRFGSGLTPKICRLCVCVLINKRSLKPSVCLDPEKSMFSGFTYKNNLLCILIEILSNAKARNKYKKA